ncbi:hypothetical protein DFQ14_112120 [Halopolyspora algeriensis]|uniref:Uncharacterized protein n=1 Tax=Halopolyspora algeriensis TaxID=1500506 RepID=A0A368VIP6_9ACTN|nr:hypothetical protein [Halopolyspora algeriensis]RCW40239.1 hypothetical protein DFQ14_112120 [Halopolyspora algeriensis]TQM46280.1 hypothetical protein FHU43_3951 [Halopolyspora algeriensis]
MVDVAEGSGPVSLLHNLVLDMTGRVDDDAVNSARRMLGAGRLEAAAELLTGCLVAGRIPVAPEEQRCLKEGLEQVHSRPALADRLHVVESPPAEEHRFAAPELPDDDIAEALRPSAGRLTSLRGLWCTSRKTPAGMAYSAVPRRVLLAEVDSEEATIAVGYQILEALDRAGLSCSVDVFSSGTDLPEYHRSALTSARSLLPDTVTTGGSGRTRAPRRNTGGDPAGNTVGEPAAESPAPAFAAAPESPVAEVVSVPDRQGPDSLTELPIVNVAPTDSAPYVPGGDTGQDTVVGLETAGGYAVRDDAVQVGMATGGGPERRYPAPGSDNPRVPAAVDAKLTDRERNLLHKLHEELAQREQDREAPAAGPTGQAAPDEVSDEQADSLSAGRQDPRMATMPGTGGFPPMGAASTPAPGSQEPSSPPQ